jgi:putative transposase
MDERHLIAAARYLALNPVAAGMVKRARDWPWSSARAHLTGKDDGVVVTAPILARVPDFAGLLKAAEDEAATRALLNSRTTGRPVGAADWIEGLEAQMGRERAAGRRGAKPKATSPDALGDGLFPTVSP